jgi:hypothetical protein
MIRRLIRVSLDRTELPAGQSAALRERLLGEIAVMQSIESATRWAQDGIITKTASQGQMPSWLRKLLR